VSFDCKALNRGSVSVTTTVSCGFFPLETICEESLHLKRPYFGPLQLPAREDCLIIITVFSCLSVFFVVHQESPIF